MAAMLLFASAIAFADDYTPTSTWPYMYSDFTQGVVLTVDGKEKPGLYNVVLSDAKLHFIDGSLVKESSMIDVASVTVAGDFYINVQGKLLKVLSKGEKAVVAESFVIDYAKLVSADGAYGSSGNTLSVKSLSSLEGIGGTRTNMNHMELRNSKDTGSTLDLIVKKCIVFNGMAVMANKKDVMDAAAAQGRGAEVANFIKTNKVKWNNVVSLQALADFLANK